VADILKAVMFVQEYIIQHMLLPGQVENWNVIMDLDKMSTKQVPKDVRSAGLT